MPTLANVIKIRVVRSFAAERAFRMYMDAMKQNPEQIMKER